MSSSRRDHHLPAAYLGRFSRVTTGRSRKRPLYVADRRAEAIFEQSAENIAFSAGLYDLPAGRTGGLGNTLDLWSYENGLSPALDELARGDCELDAELWLRYLVPFVAGLFARAPDANMGENDPGRVMAFQEMLSPVMVSRWTVLHFPKGDLLTNDRGLAPLVTPVGPGIAVPLDTSRALLLTRETERPVARYASGCWRTTIDHRNLEPAAGTQLRVALAQFALHLVCGPVREHVAAAKSVLGSKNRRWPALIVNPTDCDLACHLYDYFRVLSATRVPPDEAQAAADRIDLDALPLDWRLPIAVQVLFVERTRGGVTAKGSSLRLNVRLGMDLRHQRRTVQDFRQGAFQIVPIEDLRKGGVSLGNMCQRGDDGRGHRTYFKDPRSGTVVAMDLRPYASQHRRKGRH
jgi:hypothetical protein